MSHTTSEYLTALLTQRRNFAQALIQKGVECSENEKFNTLIKKIGTIYDTGGLAYGEWIPTSNTDTFTVTGLNAKPTSFGISCKRVIEGKATELGSIFIGVLSIDTSDDNIVLYKYLDDSTFVFDKITSELIYSIEKTDNTYSLSISLAAFNEMSAKPYLFKGGFEYNWVASSKEWFLQ